jgi:hypothetical protein
MRIAECGMAKKQKFVAAGFSLSKIKAITLINH